MVNEILRHECRILCRCEVHSNTHPRQSEYKNTVKCHEVILFVIHYDSAIRQQRVPVKELLQQSVIYVCLKYEGVDFFGILAIVYVR